MVDSAIAQDTDCIVMGLRGVPESTLNALNVLQNVPEDHFVANLEDARETAKRILERRQSPEPEDVASE